MQIQLYQVDAFASHVFEGNPAAVCPLTQWLTDAQMQAIAAENNLSETAFFVPQDDGFSIRWFTPTVEVDLCGHATLAAAFVLFELHGYSNDIIVFYSKSGQLLVSRDDDLFVLDFPMHLPRPCEVPQSISAAFKASPMACFKAEDYIVVLESEKDVRDAVPDFEMLKKLDLRGVTITAASKSYDFVSRFFAPNFGINEDPVTGSSFTQLAPVWMAILGKESLSAKQISKRGGEVWCEVRGNRVLIKGRAVLYMRAEITIPSV
ncbi:MAG: isomerase [Zetaproteobacteria bacterium CG2_30_46_52]|nr:MAG: isomerase [Zetaproteobacteria bacterium CG2_30_46_52]